LNEGVERGPIDRPALARLTGTPTADFAREYWGECALLTPRAGEFGDLFSADAVDELIADRGLRTPFVRMAAEGTVLASTAFTGPAGFGATIGDQVDSGKVLAEFAGGATLVLQALHRTWPPLAEFTRQLVSDLGHPVQVNAYVTPASSRGFDPHYDTHDVFVIQIAGAKRWRIHEPVHPHPLADQPWTQHREAITARAKDEPAIDATLQPGDVLYLPSGWIHSAIAQGDTSIHLTLGARAATRYDLLTHLLAAAADDVELRAPLGVGVDYSVASSLSADLASTIDAMQSVMQKAANDQGIATAMQSAFDSATRPAPVRPLATTELITHLAPTTRVGWRPGVGVQIEDDGDEVRIVLPSKTISLPAEASAAVHALSRADHYVGSLPDLDEESALVVVRRLLREGVLVPR
jgi:Cupin superfamily protein